MNNCWQVNDWYITYLVSVAQGYVNYITVCTVQKTLVEVHRECRSIALYDLHSKQLNFVSSRL